MRTIESEAEFADAVEAARRECLAAFGNDEVYLEKLIRRARHVEVQILGDNHGNLVHLHERDCSVQRRNQKIVEQAPAHYLDAATRAAIHESALKIGRAVGYNNAGTVEFLVDDDTGSFHFIEVNPRIQVEHTVTEVVTGVDLVQAQIRIADGTAIGAPESGIPGQDEIRVNGHAMQCRVTTEDPENNFIPDYGVLTNYRGATGFGVRLDGGTAYSGARITPFYDSLLEKVTAWAPTFEEAIRRMRRAIVEFRIRGVATNLAFLDNVINHPQFHEGACTTRFVDETPELFRFAYRRDRATRLLRYLGEVVVNGNTAVEGRPEPPTHQTPSAPEASQAIEVPDGTRQLLDELGPEAFRAMDARAGPGFDDRHHVPRRAPILAGDAGPELRPGRQVAPVYARRLPQLFSVECWGGATFDVAMRFLSECPWASLERLRAAMPNLLTQMLLRASNGVGYTTYPDNVVRYFVQQSAENGIDIFRIFDSLNWVENMRPAMDAVLETGKLCEAAICYTGDITDPGLTKYDLGYYVALARELEAAGAHILGLKDMAGLCKPAAARLLVETLKAGNRHPHSLPHPRHQRDFRGERARRGGGRCRRRGRGDGFDERAHVAAELRLDHRGLAPFPARPRNRRRYGHDALHLLGAGAQPVPRLRERIPRRHVGRLQPRNSGRTVHEPDESRRGRWVSTTSAGRRSRAPSPRSTACSATS